MLRHPSSDSKITWSRRLIAISLILLAISFVGILVLGSYFSEPITSNFSYPVADGWCNPSQEGLGKHCFSDFQAPRVVLENSLNWNDNGHLNLPPTSFVPYKLASYVEKFTSVRTSLVVYLLFLALCLVSPTIHLLKRDFRGLPDTPTYFLLIITSLPFISVLDRGASAGFAVAPLTIFALNFNKESKWSAIFAIIVATAIRPQFVLVAVAYLAVRKYREFAYVVIGSVVLTLFSFTFFGLDNFVGWIKNLIIYPSYAPLVNDFPANLSFARAIMKVLQILHVVPVQFNFSNGTINLASTGILLLFVIVIIFYLTRKTSNSILVVPICLLLPVLVPTATFSYYSLVLLPMFAFLFVPHNLVLDTGQTGQSVTTSKIDSDESVPNWWKWLIILALSLSLAPLPFVGEVRRQRYDTREIARQSFAMENFGIIWTVVVLATLVLVVKDQLKHRED
ncbi:MAG: hypothetical protein O3B17_06955, partial [Actinomycetota bacterium]|nr:hypothetical protein [Actinomycetota bacterium]